MWRPVPIQTAPSLPEFDPDAGVLGVQPLLGYPALHLHSSVSRSNLNKKFVCQAHHQIRDRNDNNAKPDRFRMPISSAC